MTPYAKTIQQLVNTVLPRYTSMPSTAKLLAVEVVAIAYGKSAGEVARDIQAAKLTKM